MEPITSKVILIISVLSVQIIGSSQVQHNTNRRISFTDPLWNFHSSTRTLVAAASGHQETILANQINSGVVSNVISRSVLQLAHDIGEKLLEESTSPNEVFSPLSISGALSLLLLGANGATYEELMNLMQYNQDLLLNENPWKIHEQFGSLIESLTRDHGFEKRLPKLPTISTWNEDQRRLRTQILDNEIEHRITVANALFVQDGFSIRPDYSSAVKNAYDSKLKNLDFQRSGSAAVQYINEWVNFKTEGKIPQILTDSLSGDTKVVIASVLHFRAMWEKTFMDGSTTQRPFYPDGLGNPSITVDMMAHGGTFPYYDAREYNCRILGIPYKHNLTTMYVILPNDSNRSRLRAMQAYLTADKIEDMISKMKMETAAVLFPKMHMSNQINLKSIFRKLGVYTLFDQQQSDLALISTGVDMPMASVPKASVPWLSQSDFPTLPPLRPLPSFSAPMGRRPYERFNFGPMDDSQDDPFIFSRIGEDSVDQANVTAQDTNSTTIEETTTMMPNSTGSPNSTTDDAKPRKIREVTYKVTASKANEPDRLSFKDFIVSKRISKLNPEKKQHRGKRHAASYASVEALKNLDGLRKNLARSVNVNPGLYAEEILHKVDLTINEKGTDGGAATVTYLYRTGTNAVFRVETPFIFLIRNDETKLPLFYGTVYEPTNI